MNKIGWLKCAMLGVALGFAGLPLSGAEEGGRFSSRTWAKVEQDVLLPDKEYREQLERCIDDMDAIDRWRAEQLSSDTMEKLNAELYAAVQKERELQAFPLDRNAMREQRKKIEKIRSAIEREWRSSEKSKEYAALQKQANSSAAKLYDLAVAKLRESSHPDAKYTLKMLESTRAIAIPGLSRLSEVPEAEAVRAQALPLSDAERFAEYERDLLLKDPGYSLLKSRCDVAFGILTQWQELQLSSSPEGRQALEAFRNASRQVEELNKNSSTEVEARAEAMDRLNQASETLRKVQYYTFKDDKQNMVLTDAYYNARTAMLKKAVELLKGANTADSVAMAAKLTSSMKADDTARKEDMITLNSASGPTLEKVPLESWEKRYFRNDAAYLRLKSEYLGARRTLSDYQESRLSDSATGAVLYDQIRELDREIKARRQIGSVDADLQKMIELRNRAVRELSGVYKEMLSDDATNEILQSRVTRTRKLLLDYAREKLSLMSDADAKKVLETLK